MKKKQHFLIIKMKVCQQFSDFTHFFVQLTLNFLIQPDILQHKVRMLQNRMMYEQMESNKRFNSEQQLQTHSRSRDKLQKNVMKMKKVVDFQQQQNNYKLKDRSKQTSKNLGKKNCKQERFQNASSFSSKSQTQSNQATSESSNLSYKKKGQIYSYKNKYNVNSKEIYNRIVKTSQTLIQKPQINDPQLEQSMEKILFKLAKDIKQKNRKRYDYEQPIHYDPSLPKAFSKDAFSFREDLSKTIKQQYYNSPFMPPSLRMLKGEKTLNDSSAASSEKIRPKQSKYHQKVIKDSLIQGRGCITVVNKNKMCSKKSPRVLSIINRKYCLTSKRSNNFFADLVTLNESQ